MYRYFLALFIQAQTSRKDHIMISRIAFAALIALFAALSGCSSTPTQPTAIGDAVSSTPVNYYKFTPSEPAAPTPPASAVVSTQAYAQASADTSPIAHQRNVSAAHLCGTRAILWGAIAWNPCTSVGGSATNSADSSKMTPNYNTAATGGSATAIAVGGNTTGSATVATYSIAGNRIRQFDILSMICRERDTGGSSRMEIESTNSTIDLGQANECFKALVGIEFTPEVVTYNANVRVRYAAYGHMSCREVTTDGTTRFYFSWTKSTPPVEGDQAGCMDVMNNLVDPAS